MAKKITSKCSCSSLFVIVHVTYDYYRYQFNIGASTDIDTARKIAINYKKEKEYDGEPPLPIIEDKDKSSDMDSPETNHIWIEVFPQNLIKLRPIKNTMAKTNKGFRILHNDSFINVVKESDYIDLSTASRKLAEEVDSLNEKCLSMGAGKMVLLKDLAKEVFRETN